MLNRFWLAVAVATALIAVLPATAARAQDDDPGGGGQLGSIGDFVWVDLNENGLQDVGEPGLAGVEVTAFSFSGAPARETVTDALGAYVIEDLPADNYIVDFDLPDGFRFTAANVGDDDSIDSDTASGIVLQVEVASGVAMADLDVGALPPLPKVDGVVFIDINGNGLQDDGAGGLGGIDVQLYSQDGLENFATTDATGRYAMTITAPGEYWIRFLNLTPSLVTEQDAGDDDSIDSDIDTNGRTPRFFVTSDSPAAGTFDAGLLQPAGSIGDFVFEDLDEDGVQDPDEPGLAGAVLDLVDRSDSVVATTVSDAAGAYGFSDVVPGTYTVRVSLPDNRLFTTNLTTANAGANSDIDPMTGEIASFELRPGATIDDLDVGVLPVDNDDVLGDVNCDGSSNVIDALLMTLYDVSVRGAVQTCGAYSSDASVIAVLNGDVNASGTVDIVDALFVAQCDAALNNVFCPVAE